MDKITFSEIIKIAEKNGFIFNSNLDFNQLIYQRKDDIKVEISFPDDNLLSKLDEKISPLWGFKLINILTDELIFESLYDIWWGTPTEKINFIKTEIIDFIDKISNYEIRIELVYRYKILGFRFLKNKELQFKLEDGWKQLF
jgi:hypothetical protein